MTKIERMDQLRRKGLTWFFWIFASVMGAYLFLAFALKIAKPGWQRFDLLSHEQALRIVGRWTKLLKVITPIVGSIVIIGLIAALVFLAIWSRYNKRLKKDHATEVAVRDERISFFWQIAFRKSLAAIILFQFILWAANSIYFLVFEKMFIDIGLLDLMTLYLIAIFSIGIFLRLDSLDRRSGENLSKEYAPWNFRLSSVERVLARRPVPILATYIGWHLSYIFFRIFVTAIDLSDDSPDFAVRMSNRYEIFSFAQLLWLSILGIILLYFLRREKRDPFLDDEGIRQNWLKACRWSWKPIFLFLLIPILSMFVGLFIYFFMGESGYFLVMDMLSKNSYYLFGHYLVPFLAITVLLGSYIYFDRRAQGDDHAAEK